jgi:putative transcriptional regulator
MQKTKRRTSTSVGSRMIQGLQEFVDVLRAKKPLSEHFKCTKLTLSLKASSYDARRIKETRLALGASEQIFARLLGVSERTVRAWEQGTRAPRETTCRFMDEIRRDFPHWIKRLRQAVVAE